MVKVRHAAITCNPEFHAICELPTDSSCANLSQPNEFSRPIASPTASAVSVAILAARIAQSLIHVSFAQTNAVVSVRFGFFTMQIAGFVWLIAIVVAHAAGRS